MFRAFFFVMGVVAGYEQTYIKAVLEFSFSEGRKSNERLLDFARGICFFELSEGVTQGQMANVFFKYLENHPERRHEDAAELVLESLAKSFPCEAKS